MLRLAGTWRIEVMMLPFEVRHVHAGCRVESREVEAIRMGLFWLLTKLCSPLCFCQEGADVVMSLPFHNLPVGLGFVVLALFSAGSVSAVVFVAAFHPPKRRGASGRWNAPNHGDGGRAAGGAASRGLTYRHCDKCVNRCPKRALRQTSNLKTPMRMRRGRRQNASEDGDTGAVGRKNSCCV